MPTATTKPIKLYDHRGRAMWCGGGDRLIGPTRQTQDRKRVPLLNQDLHRNVSAYGRILLMSLGRFIYFNSAAIRGAVEDLARDVAGTFMFESRSKSPEFQAAAEALLYQHDRFCDVAGPPFNHRFWRKHLVRVAAMLDGDLGTVWVKGEDGYPYLQTIPAHRIYANEMEVQQRGPTDGARIVDGVIVDDSNKALAYRVQADGSGKDFVDVPASSMCLHFVPLMPGQLRGLSILGLAAWDVQDLQESERWELLAQKGAAARVFVEWNEAGEAPIGSDFYPPGSATTAASQEVTGIWREEIGPGLNTYFKGNTGSDLKAVEFNRPAREQQAFAREVLRKVFSGAGLSWDFHLSLERLGGAPLRLLTEKINRRHEDIHADLLEPACRRFDFFRLGHFIEHGFLPVENDWWNFEYQPAAHYTPDRGYDMDVSAQELRIGISSRTRVAGRRTGEALMDTRDTREAELDDLMTRAERLQAKHPKWTLDECVNRLESDYPNRSPVPAEEGARAATVAEPATPGEERE